MHLKEKDVHLILNLMVLSKKEIKKKYKGIQCPAVVLIIKSKCVQLCKAEYQNVELSVQWRKNYVVGKLTWDLQDDGKLDEDLDMLYRKYGESIVQRRILFLDQL